MTKMANPTYLKKRLVQTTMFLTCVGILFIYGASAMKGAIQFSNPYFFLNKQLSIAFLGFCCLFFVQLFPLSWLKHLPLPMILLSLFLLSLIFIPSAYLKVGGAARWLHLGGLRFQTSELAKISMVFFLAKNLSREKWKGTSFFKELLPNFLVLLLMILFLLKQPDFGSSVLVLLLTFLMLIVSGVKKDFLLYTGGIALGALGFLVFTAPYRFKRLLSFLNPWSDLHHGGFQIIQSFLAFQNGGFFGVGIGQSKQKLFFLPEAHTDFIFSVIAEELGFIGVVSIIGLFCYIAYLGYQVSISLSDKFYKFLAFGITSLISLQALLNIAVAMGCLPTKGLPLPFISSGSSSLLIFLLCMAILTRLAKEAEVFYDNSQ